jgi:valyl-tRNA synthetase
MKLSKAYEPLKYESDIYALWEKSGAFKPEPASHEDSFSLVMPPPNANAGLHVGHASFAYADIIARYQRLKGKSVLYLPGADHAGLETWVVYEKYLNSKGQTRFDFSREELYAQVWDFVEQNKSNFLGQFRRLGLSLDWTKFTYTLDEKVVKTVYSTFQKMWDDGSIYRGERLVNFCTHHGTSFSDIEVERKEQQGKLWQISYKLSDGSGEVEVATTRPETMFGDTAVAIHPDHPRAKELVGKTVRVPLTERDIPVIADNFVEEDFGTGVVKITPAHDFTDNDVAQRHNLPMITVIDHEGKMNQNAPKKYVGLTVLDARQMVIEDLKKIKHLTDEKDYTNQVAVCYKCGSVIEPLLREQWFVSMQPLAQKAIKAIKDGDVKFYPAAKGRDAVRYLENVRDWNISRQIAWGIPIPAFQSVDEPDKWIFSEDVSSETIEVDGKTYHRDPDVFDTWFSSGQWPYVTLDFPDGQDFKQFYPNGLMECGREILYQWVCRMMIFGLYVTGDVPFKTVYLHGMIQDDHGHKMSKSRGNVVDVIKVLDEYGSDAVRLSLVSGQTAGNDQPFSNAKLVSGRNFANKLWNMARFVEDKLGENKIDGSQPITIADHWVLSKLQQGEKKISQALSNYRLGEAYDELYHLVWDDIADWYVEASKVILNPGLLKFVLETVLKLSHPFAPFVTETIWQTIHGNDENDLLVSANWPEISQKIDKQAVEQFELLKAVVSEIRFISSALQVTKPSLYFKDAPFLVENAEMITRLGRLAKVTEVEAGRGMHLTSVPLDAWLDIDNRSAHTYLRKLDVSKDEKTASIARLEARLSNKSYVKNAPENVVAETKSQLESELALLEKIKAEIAIFQNLAQ